MATFRLCIPDFRTFSGYKKEQCPVCLSFFTVNHPPLDPNGLPSVLPDRRLFEPEQQDRCHGCWIARFAVSFFALIVDRSCFFDMRFCPVFYIDSTLDGTELVFEANGHLERREVSLEMLKTTLPSSDISWLRYLPCFDKVWPPRSLPVYLEQAFEAVPISGDTGSEAAFEKICSWFQTCASTHTSCGNNLDIHPMPTRLIDITSKDDLRLVEGESIRSPYVALSHRWIDADKMPRCTGENIDSFRKNIPWSCLTLNFQDFVSFIQEFSKWFARQYPDQGTVRYVWIDSLCIIQDSVADWQAESKLMCSVYEGAILTVAAAAGKDKCFSQAERVYKGFEVTNPQKRNPRLFLRKQLPDHPNALDSALIESSQIPPSTLDLLTRGWVVQERLLSRRFVIFAPNEVMWECLEGSDCECGKSASRTGQRRPGGQGDSVRDIRESIDHYCDECRSDDPSYSPMPVPLKVAYYRSVNDKGKQAARIFRNSWRRLVEYYSSLDLTKEFDRLPAIAGLATHFGRCTGMGMESYVAGVWQDSLPVDLVWFTSSPVEHFAEERHGTATVPSWSWAACGSRVSMLREVEGAELKVYPQLAPLPVAAGTTDGVGLPVSMKCPVFTDLNDLFDHEKFPKRRREYCPDLPPSTAEPPGQGMYALLLKIQSDLCISWIFLHVELVSSDGHQVRRLGLLHLEIRRTSISEDWKVNDDVMRSCFGKEAVHDLELI